MKKLINYVEVQTKITSFFTFIFALLVMRYNNYMIKPVPTMIFFVGMLLFDLTTTAINNYIDSKENGQDLGYTRRQAKVIMFVLLGLSILMGLWLVHITDLIVLIIGMMCFAIGILYTYGPIPISRQPYGEIISGVMYGYFIPFIIFHINNPGIIGELSITHWNLSISLNLIESIQFILIFMTPTVLTASIMLANNTCDVEQDVLVKRFTLPYYLGEKNALILMKLLYVCAYGSLIICVGLGVLPVSALGVLLSGFIVLKNYRLYRKDLIKHVSFKYVIKNFIIIMTCLVILVAIGVLIT